MYRQKKARQAAGVVAGMVYRRHKVGEESVCTGTWHAWAAAEGMCVCAGRYAGRQGSRQVRRQV